jgi:hypothetical protein
MMRRAASTRNVFHKFPKYNKKILLGDFNAKVGRENNFELTTGNESLHDLKMSVKNTMFHIATFINLLGRLHMGKPTVRPYSDRKGIRMFLMFDNSRQHNVISSGGDKR